MSSIDFTLTTQDGRPTLSVYGPDFEGVITPAHPFYGPLVDHLAIKGEPYDVEFVRDRVEPTRFIGKQMSEISNQITWDTFNLFYQGIKISGPLSEEIKRRIATGDGDWKRLARFLVSLEENPSRRAKNAVWDWVQKHGVSIAEDGRMLGYKGLVAGQDALTGEEVPVSVHAGPNNFIDGVLYGETDVAYQVPHRLGTVISKRRSDVDDNNRLACSTGLHVGAYSYAKTFGENRADGARYSTMGRVADSLPNSTFALVAFRPQDVVSVPEDGTADWKIRVAAYEPVEFLEEIADVLKDQTSYPVATAAPFIPPSEQAEQEDVGEVATYVEPEPEVPAEVRWWEIYSTDNLGETVYETISGTEEDAQEVLEVHDPEGEFGYAYRETDAPGEEDEDAEAPAEPALDAAPPASENGDLVEPTEGTGLFNRKVLRDWAAVNPALARDLADSSLGHSEVARKYSEITTESSVRRYRKSDLDHSR